MKDPLELLKSLSKVDVYRGTVKGEILDSFQKAISERERAQDEFHNKQEEFWDKVYTELDIDPDKVYKVEPLTGQVFEKVPADELKAESKEG